MASHITARWCITVGRFSFGGEGCSKLMGFSVPRIVLAALSLSVALSTPLHAEQLHTSHRGIGIYAEIVEDEVIDGVRVTPPEEATDIIREAVDRMSEMSAEIQERIAELHAAGDIVIVYDARLPDATWSSINLASYLPAFYDPAGGERRFVVTIGRTGIQWDLGIISAVLAHEMAGHAYQHYEGRLGRMRLLDAECEAYLIQEMAMQDLGVDKTTEESIGLRQALESHWCRDFRSYTRVHDPETHATWQERNPDVARLLDAFTRYQESDG